MRTLILTIALLFLIPISLYASARSNSGGLAERVAELEAQVEILAAALQEAQGILQYVRVETEEIRNLAGPHLIFEGVNVHVRSGSGDTSDGCPFIPPDDNLCESLTGLGNLIVGYNKKKTAGGFPEIRVGSHNLIVGDFHSYWSFSSFVAGGNNLVAAPYASVCGGTANRATGFASSIAGGEANVASGFKSSVSGGQDREAPDDFNWAAGELFEEN